MKKPFEWKEEYNIGISRIDHFHFTVRCFL